MTITDEDYNKISDTAYWIDPLHKKYDPTIKDSEIREINGKEYEILRVENNTDNGMQAMAVAPIVNGKADTSQVVIAYAGTNTADSLDIATDAQTVGFGLETLSTFHLFGPADYVDAQSVTANDSQTLLEISTPLQQLQQLVIL